MHLKENPFKEDYNSYFSEADYIKSSSVCELEKELIIGIECKHFRHNDSIRITEDKPTSYYGGGFPSPISIERLGQYNRPFKVWRSKVPRLFNANTDPSILASFKVNVEESKYILDFKDGWDDGEAKAISPLLFETSCKIVHDYLERLYLSGNPKPNPSISPVSDGSIDFEWGSEKSRLLLNFKIKQNGEIESNYYGDLWNNKLATKGSVPADKVYTHLLDWMQYL